MLDTLLVALIVSLAALHVARRYLPRIWKRRTVPSAAAGCATACSSCNGCGSAKRDR